MIELSKKGYTKQMALYLQNQDYEKAYEFGLEFANSYPDEMIAHYQLSAAAYHVGKYEEGREHGRKAFNMATADHDMLACAVQASLCYLKLGQYREGFHLLKEMEKRKRQDQLENELQEALFVFSVVMKNKAEAVDHIDKLYALNKELALKLMKSYMGE